MERLTNGQRLKPLLMSDYIDLADMAWKWRHDSAVATVKDAELSPEERLRVLDQVDMMRGTRGPLIYWTWTFEGSREIVRRSLLRGHVPDTDQVLDECDPDELRLAAIHLLGIKVSEEVGESTENPRHGAIS